MCLTYTSDVAYLLLSLGLKTNNPKIFIESIFPVQSAISRSKMVIIVGYELNCLSLLHVLF